MEQIELLDVDVGAEYPLVCLWADGSCIKNPGGSGGWAFILCSENGNVIDEKYGHIPAPTTNNRAEWIAIIQGLSSLTEKSRVVVKTDSMICVNAINGVGKKMHKRGNLDLVKTAIDLCNSHVVVAEWVKGHSGVKENERCDFLANRANKK